MRIIIISIIIIILLMTTYTVNNQIQQRLSTERLVIGTSSSPRNGTLITSCK